MKIKATNKSRDDNKNKTTQTSDENHSEHTRAEYTRRENSETAAIDKYYYEDISSISTGRNLSYGAHDHRAGRFEPSTQDTNDYYENP